MYGLSELYAIAKEHSNITSAALFSTLIVCAIGALLYIQINDVRFGVNKDQVIVMNERLALQEAKIKNKSKSIKLYSSKWQSYQ